MIQLYDLYSNYLGNNAQKEYTFDFLITKLDDIKIIKLDDTGEIVSEVDGNDTTIVDSIEFDSVKGGGTVTLLANLETDYELYLILNPVQPLQETSIRDKNNLNLRTIEQLFDYVVTILQRLTFQQNRSVRLSDKQILNESFDLTWPDDMVDISAAGCIPIVNDTGTGLKKGPDASDIANAQQYAEDAEAAKIAAEAAQAATEALQPLVIGSSSVPYDIVAGTGLVIPVTSSKKIVAYVQGSGGAVDISANPQITAPTLDAQELEIICCSDTNTVKVDDGNGVKLNGSEYTMVNNSILLFISKGTTWVLKSTNNI